MSSFLAQYRNRNLNDTLNKAFSAQNTSDPRFWNVTRGTDGTGIATIRFLPNIKGEAGDFVTLQQYDFTNPATGRRYEEKSLATLGKADPVQEYWSMLWGQGRKDEAKLVSRRFTYYTNVYVLKDAAKPDAQNSVKIYRFGKTIMDILDDARKADRGGLPSISPYELFSYPRAASDEEVAAWIKANPVKPGEPRYPGANFVLRVTSRGGEQNFPSYEKSTFDAPSALGPDAFLEKVLGDTHNLDDFVRPNTFKTYDELKEIFENVMGFKGKVYAVPAGMPSSTTSSGVATAETANAASTSVIDESLKGDMDHLSRLIAEAR